MRKKKIIRIYEKIFYEEKKVMLNCYKKKIEWSLAGRNIAKR